MSVITITKDNFQQEIMESSQTVMLDFWASWCGPCRALGPIIEDIAKEYEGKIIVGKVNVDEESNLAAEYGIISIPTLILFKDGKEAVKKVGLLQKAAIESFLNE